MGRGRHTGFYLLLTVAAVVLAGAIWLAAQADATVGCPLVTITGQVYDVTGRPAAGRRLTIAIQSAQRIGTCTVTPSQQTVLLTVLGNVPDGTTAPQGAIIAYALEGDVVRKVTMPFAATTSLAQIVPTPAAA